MPVPVVTVAQMRDWEERSWAAGRSVEDVMDRAGQAVAQRAVTMSRVGDRILFLVGKGNNGGDARLAATHLLKRDNVIADVSDPRVGLNQIKDELAQQPALIIDGLFGIGLNRALDGDWMKMVDCINGARLPVLSVDVPSGLDANKGEPLGGSVRADVTVTFGAAKTGMLKTKAAEYTGRLEVVSQIGLIDCPIKNEMAWVEADDFNGFPPDREVTGHKGDYGHLGIIAGSLGYHGAAVLAARGAMRAQPGLITLVTPRDVHTTVASQLSQPMVHPWSARALEVLDQCTALLVGPGLADEGLPAEICEKIAQLWLESSKPIIADASALDMIERTSANCFRLITPHPGEAARLLGVDTATVQADRLAALRKLAARMGSSVVLKGHQTLVGASEHMVSVNSSGNPHLAQGGSGDVLAGLVGGWIAQPRFQTPEMAATAVRYAVWRHGQAADRMPPQFDGWGMDELIRHLK